MIQELKHKGKIVDNQSASLIGVIDETNTLEQNEVYVNIKNNEELILSGEVFVTKNPCLHPGDIKILKAKGKCPQLSHLICFTSFSNGIKSDVLKSSKKLPKNQQLHDEKD